jgi:hypothetical protein
MTTTKTVPLSKLRFYMRDFVPDADSSQSGGASQSLALQLSAEEIRFTAKNMVFTQHGDFVLPVSAIGAYSAEWIPSTTPPATSSADAAASPSARARDAVNKSKSNSKSVAAYDTTSTPSMFRVSIEVNHQELKRRGYAPPMYRVNGNPSLERILNYFTFYVNTAN